MPTIMVVITGSVLGLLLVALLTLLLSSLRRTSDAVRLLGERLDTLEGRAGDLHGEFAAVDDGLSDIAAALREHRVGSAGDATTAATREAES